jgi:CTP synthase (UTP-ammonia lyase)
VSAPLRIGIIGDYDPKNVSHLQTDDALQHVAGKLKMAIDAQWLPTDEEHELEVFDGLWCSPGSPYKSLAGALRSVEFARKRVTPLIGTCGGFQHMTLEYARNVLGLEDAAHAEYDPYASRLFVRPLSCSLKGRSMQVFLDHDSRATDWYGRFEAEESYYCDFGLNPEYQQEMHDAGLRVTGWDADREARIVELWQHPFYLGTLFIPQARSTADSPHPLVQAFVRAASLNAQRVSWVSRAVR